MNAPFRQDIAELDVAIIGAGFSGMGMGIALKKEGRTNFRIFEKESDLGGTWYLNRYPGCACDVPSFLYSYSFAQNPDWSRSYSPQGEIWRYMKAIAERYGVAPHMRFSTAVESAEWDEAKQFWRVHLKHQPSSGSFLFAPRMRVFEFSLYTLALRVSSKVEAVATFLEESSWRITECCGSTGSRTRLRTFVDRSYTAWVTRSWARSTM